MRALIGRLMADAVDKAGMMIVENSSGHLLRMVLLITLTEGVLTQPGWRRQQQPTSKQRKQTIAWC